MRYLVTGSAGFIGFHVARRLLADGHTVVGYDAFTPYYDVALKESRHAILEALPNYTGFRGQLEDQDKLKEAWKFGQVDAVVHLAAQAGVRYSLDNPRSYVDANVVGTLNVLELARRLQIKHLMIASTSSAYGLNVSQPFRESDRTAHPLTIYAATKIAGEMMAHSYSHLWGIPITMFRFFTVYGPWGRPDMAMFKFTKGIIEGTPIDLYNHGQLSRDFTYVGDIAEAIVRLLSAAPVNPTKNKPVDPTVSPVGPHRVVNIGGGRPVRLTDFVDEIERCVGRKAIRNLMPMQQGDVLHTQADGSILERLTGYRPSTSLQYGVEEFVTWYRSYYKV